MENQENEQTASSTIILKLPLSRLKYLKNDFEGDEDGLRLEEFLSTMVEHTKFENVGEILKVIPSMIDFFRDVDINGDGQMDWQEFTQSIVVGSEKEIHYHNEKFRHVGDLPIQKPPAHFTSTCSKIVGDLKRIFISIKDEILLYGLHEQSRTLLTPLLKKFQLQKLDPTDKYKLFEAVSSPNSKPSNETMHPENKHKGIPVDEHNVTVPYVLSMSFINSLSTLAVLRSDNTVEFFRMIVRVSSSNMSETIEKLGLVQLGKNIVKYFLQILM